MIESMVPVLESARTRLDDAGVVGTLPARYAAQLDRVLVSSEYATDILARYPQLIAELIESGRLDRPLKHGELDPLLAVQAPMDAADSAFLRQLRLFRHRELLRIIWRNISGLASCDETLAELSALADACIRAAFLRANAELQGRYGIPRSTDGDESRFIIVAMGKLGGGELNFSSDVDLVFLYSEPGETDGARSQTNEEYFRRLAQQLIRLLSDKTPDGFVYRVDARLRPFGDSGPLAVSVAAFEDYLVQHGRNWERYAWVKARIVNAWDGAHEFYSSVLRPFVYRRYLDFGVFASLREMKALIEQEGRAAANRENVKLGPGGIREIEFIVQTLQLVRGGTDRALRQRSLVPALEQLGVEGLMPEETVEQLLQAYRFLRQLENRLQMIRDRQTHELPSDDEQRGRLAVAMDADSWDAVYAELNEHRRVVQATFDDVLRHERGAGEEAPPQAGVIEQLAEMAFADPQAIVERINAFRSSTQYTRMDKLGQQRLDRLLPAMMQACAQSSQPEKTLDSTLRVIEAIGRRSAYIALLNENEAALQQLVRVCGSSDFLARQVAAHPLLLDELLDQRVFMAAPTRADLESDLRHRLEGAATDDTEQRFEALRNFQQAGVFRVAIADLNDTLPLMRVSDRLTDIAELVLSEAIRLAMDELVARHGTPRCTVDGVSREAGFAIAGYGKLGGLELGYGSDLDIVFMHDSAGEAQETDGDKPLENAVFFGRLARRVTHILTMPTPTGALYEVDTRLRPSGNSGLLVTSLNALDVYQEKEAWTWEHQALLRARAVAGEPGVCAAFEALRVRVLTRYVRRDGLREEVAKMRERMRRELDKSDAERFDLKQGAGGLIDIEFLVQFLVLLHAANYPALVEYSDNIRQLDALRDAGILTAEISEALADTYRSYRERIHLLSLAGKPRMAAADEFEEERSRVRALWQEHLTSPAG